MIHWNRTCQHNDDLPSKPKIHYMPFTTFLQNLGCKGKNCSLAILVFLCDVTLNSSSCQALILLHESLSWYLTFLSLRPPSVLPSHTQTLSGVYIILCRSASRPALAFVFRGGQWPFSIKSVIEKVREKVNQKLQWGRDSLQCLTWVAFRGWCTTEVLA